MGGGLWLIEIKETEERNLKNEEEDELKSKTEPEESATDDLNDTSSHDTKNDESNNIPSSEIDNILSEYSSEEIEYARVWLQHGENQEIGELNVIHIRAGEPITGRDRL
ncbi:hypothetical protein [Alkalibacillus haloalkaliphilus]|uniref:hypothetical protein n=1 Tax=Alkalibacillus haloalkaliphilus TaxID=94136 RepID=UPI0002D76A0D|nr:hypothetical protein [Alkalibacillus haloalkaliphilus]